MNHKPAIVNIRNFYFFCILISLFYCLIKEQYNGDFIKREVQISNWLLLFNCVLSFIPYIFVYKLYCIFYRKKSFKTVTLPIKFIQVFSIIILILHLIISIIWGVGKATAGVYEAPFIIKPLIQITMRFPYVLWGGIALLSTNKKRFILFVLVLIVFISLARASMGGMFICLLILYAKYYIEMTSFIRKYKVIVLLLLILSPIVIGMFYDIRANLRGEEYEKETNVVELLAGRFFARLSSFTNSAYIIENAPTFILSTTIFDNYFFQRNMCQVFSGTLTTGITPEMILCGNDEGNVSFMLGTQGILIYSLYKSLFCFIINLLSIMIMGILFFKIFSLFHFDNSLDFAFIMWIGPTMSGVSSEYSEVLVCSFIMFFVLSCYNSFKKYHLNING